MRNDEAVDEQEIRGEIARLRGEMAERAAQIRELERFLVHPRVTPVIHYMQYFSQEEETFDGTAEEAFRHLVFMGDYNYGSPLGVSVGGAFIAFEDWEEQESLSASG